MNIPDLSKLTLAEVPTIEPASVDGKGHKKQKTHEGGIPGTDPMIEDEESLHESREGGDFDEDLSDDQLQKILTVFVKWYGQIYDTYRLELSQVTSPIEIRVPSIVDEYPKITASYRSLLLAKQNGRNVNVYMARLLIEAMATHEPINPSSSKAPDWATALGNELIEFFASEVYKVDQLNVVVLSQYSDHFQFLGNPKANDHPERLYMHRSSYIPFYNALTDFVTTNGEGFQLDNLAGTTSPRNNSYSIAFTGPITSPTIHSVVIFNWNQQFNPLIPIEHTQVPNVSFPVVTVTKFIYVQGSPMIPVEYTKTLIWNELINYWKQSLFPKDPFTSQRLKGNASIQVLTYTEPEKKTWESLHFTETQESPSLFKTGPSVKILHRKLWRYSADVRVSDFGIGSLPRIF